MLLRRFSINKLHGYKDIEINFSDKTKILVAENGSGKTTVLNALNALLTLRFKRLSSLEFESIEVVFQGGEAVKLPKAALSEAAGIGEDLADKLGAEAGIGGEEVLRFVRMEHAEDGSWATSHPIFRRIHMGSPNTSETILQKLNEIRNALFLEELNLGSIKDLIRKGVGNTEIVFLPTYRRVELPLIRPARHLGEGRYARRPPSRFGANLDARFRGMNFGLADVEERLGELADEVERRSNSEYRIVSARMVNQLLQGRITNAEAEQYPLPDMDALEMFFARVERGDRIEKAQSLSRFYEHRSTDSEQQIFLRYFLGQLSQVIDQTKAIEEMLRAFVDACNEYLMLSEEEKFLSYVPESMKVEVRNSWTGREVSMDALSSGEKQVISLMAKLYLEPSRKLILIDEPELSLSIDWQRRILLDVQRPDTVDQFLAITHSPFVFDNDLSRYAEPMSILRHKVSQQ